MSSNDKAGAAGSPRESVQANLIRQIRYGETYRPTWRLFLFFEIFSASLAQKRLEALKSLLSGRGSGKNWSAQDSNGRGEKSAVDGVTAMKLLDFGNELSLDQLSAKIIGDDYPQVAWSSAGIAERSKLKPADDADAQPKPAAGAADMPHWLFRHWLGSLAGAPDGGEGLGKVIKSLLGQTGNGGAGGAGDAGFDSSEQTGSTSTSPDPIPGISVEMLREACIFFRKQYPDQAGGGEDDTARNSALMAVISRFLILAASDALGDKIGQFEEEAGGAEQAGIKALQGGLAFVFLYDLLRHWARVTPTRAPDDQETGYDPNDGKVQSESGREQATGRNGIPANIGFTWRGLKRSGVEQATLESFPEVFREGMAARAGVLGDDGPSAPQNWDGYLGLPNIHLMLATGLRSEREDSVICPLLDALRADCDAFNIQAGAWGSALRLLLRTASTFAGMGLLHCELGEDPYWKHARPDSEASYDTPSHAYKRPVHRMEHFGFRDGISQPYLELGLTPKHMADPAIGGGTPGRDGSWDPLALGEIFLSEKDEDGNGHRQPNNAALREGSTYLVFRKLEQDVAGMRAFLASQRPGDPQAQDRLAAQFMGRWQNGTPLVRSPHAMLEADGGDLAFLNDFRYLDSDPDGRKCPLGAHIRRTNPRDIGRLDNVRRHRILRRSISYGGPFLPEGSLGDGRKRGMLFMAVNARIDAQFELVQSGWINKGEFLGQAGLGKCPVTGSHDGTWEDRFFEAGSGAPVTGLPRFVINRGGDYFFMPGVPVLHKLAAGDPFTAQEGHLKTPGQARTPDLLDPDVLRGITYRILSGKSRVERVTFRNGNGETGNYAFVARHGDVVNILGDATTGSGAGDGGKDPAFSVAAYKAIARQMTGGGTMIIAEDEGDTRDILNDILRRSWLELGKRLAGEDCEGLDDKDCYKKASRAIGAKISAITRRHVDSAFRRSRHVGHLNLVQDFAVEAAYGVNREIFGIPGPDYLTELAVALPFGKWRFGEMPAGWLKRLDGDTLADTGQKSFQIWSVILMAALVGNVYRMGEVDDLATQAGTELMLHLRGLVRAANERIARSQYAVEDASTLVDVMVAMAPDYVKGHPARPSSARGKDKRPFETVEAYHAAIRYILFELAGTSLSSIPQTFANVVGFYLDNGISIHELISLMLRENAWNEPLANAMIYEAERLNSNLPVMMRMCTRDFELPAFDIELPGKNKITIPPGKILAGDKVLLCISGAAFDGLAFQDPMDFKLDREPSKYLMFGAAGSQRECWGRDRVSLIVLRELMAGVARMRGLRPMAGVAGEPDTLFRLTVGRHVRFNHIDPA